jgi:hypothetical protein
MRRRRGPQLASLTFTLIVVLAVAALAWGATHNKSTGHGLGSAKDQTTARTALSKGLQLPAGLARDSTFTACGSTADACLTGAASVAGTLTALTTVIHSAGGSLPDTCTTVAPGTSGADVPRFTCVVQGELDGASVVFLLGDGWLLPGHPTPRTAVVANVLTSTGAPLPIQHPALPTTPADPSSLLPATWVSAPQPCTAVPSPSASAPTSAPTSPPSPSSAPLSLTTTTPLPACTPNATTITVGVHAVLATASAQLSALAVSKGFRLDGRPCIAGSTPTSCGVWGERISACVQELFVATLVDDGHGNTTGSLAVTEQR